MMDKRTMLFGHVSIWSQLDRLAGDAYERRKNYLPGRETVFPQRKQEFILRPSVMKNNLRAKNDWAMYMYER